jgi:glycosyltransferase involved in cell wall biosynthesis
MELGGFSKYHPFIMYLQYYENYAYKHSDGVISILPNTKEHTMAHGLKPDKWYYVPNGIIKEDWENAEDLPALHKEKIAEYKDQGFKLIAYTGNLGVSNILDTFIESKQFLKTQKVAYILLGTGTEEAKLKELAKKQKDVLFLPLISKFAIPNFLKAMDLLYIGLKKENLFKYGISPNKIFDYMMAAKPFIQAIEAGNNPVMEANAGLSIEPENSMALADAIDKLFAMSDAERLELGNNGRKFVLNNHDYAVLAKKNIEILNKI